MTRSLPASRRIVTVAALSIAAMLPGVAGLGAQRSAVPSKADARTVAHVLDRIGFGARPGDVARVQQIGLAAYIDAQLHPERIADGALAARLSEFPTLTKSTAELTAENFRPAEAIRRQQQAAQARAQAMDPTMAGAPPAPPQPSPEQRMLQQAAQAPVQELMQAKILRAVLSEKQLEEVLVDFWFNHFNVFVGKGQVREYLTEYERDVIRPHVLGDFRKLLGATAHSPAMLFYLDNFQSRTDQQVAADVEMRRRLGDPGLPPMQRRQLEQRLTQMQNQPRRPQGGLNENYARELMELHTLGVDAGYTQQDVIEVAKVFTGWTIDRPQQGGSFVFRPQMHEPGSKAVLGKKIGENGEREGEQVLDLLASHPATAKHIAFKLAQRFVADEPPAALVDRVAKRFLDTKGDLREVTRAIVNAQPMVQALRELGMPLYGAQPPTGYSMTADAWVNTGALLNRMNFAVQLVSGGMPQRAGGPGRGGGDQMMPPPQRPNRQGGAGRQGQLGVLQRRPDQLARAPIQVDVRSLAPDTTPASVDHAIATLLAREVSDATRQTISRAETPQQLVALTLGSPEFQKR
jgi:uncharacterized protein (DUF1800 family)